MSKNLTAYYAILASLPDEDYSACVEYLKLELAYLFAEEYGEKFDSSQIYEFEVNGYTYMFDTFENDRDARIVGAYGRVLHTDLKRDSTRMKGFIGAFSQIEPYKDFDKGHFVAHKINGNLDQNLYPQLRELNRGWSAQGKLFRSMERFCEQNPDVFMFTRPIYLDASWIPHYIDYGIFTMQFGLLLNRFDNRKTIEPAAPTNP